MRRMILSVLLTVFVMMPVLSSARTIDVPREMNVFLKAPMRPSDARVPKIKAALDALTGISESANVYGNRIKLKRIPGKTVSIQQIQAALHSVDPAVNLNVVDIKMWGLWVIKFKNYDQSKDKQVLEAFQGVGSAMENVKLVAPGVFSFKAGNQGLKRLIQRTFGRAAFGSAFDRNRDPADFIDTWVWGGTTAP